MYLVLDIARAIAALAVFLFHLTPDLRDTIPWLAKYSVYGYLGVPIFL